MFLLSQNDENQSENGSKNSKIRLRARPPAEPQKKMLQTKKLRSKSWKTRFFFTFRLPILDGRVHEQVSSVLFFTVFFEGERNDLSKTQGFGRKMAPGKPVTFYECHPEDHAPAPSVRADFLFQLLKSTLEPLIAHSVPRIVFYVISLLLSWNRCKKMCLFPRAVGSRWRLSCNDCWIENRSQSKSPSQSKTRSQSKKRSQTKNRSQFNNGSQSNNPV